MSKAMTIDEGVDVVVAPEPEPVVRETVPDVSDGPILTREFAGPSRWTFGIKPIKRIIDYYQTWAESIDSELGSVDPFAGKLSPASVRNDLNPENEAEYHMDALEFLRSLGDECASIVYFDPPYSMTQVKECYQNIGIAYGPEKTRCDYFSNIKNEIARILVPGGVSISCGWNSNGITKSRNFETIEVAMIRHGGCHNDTIVVVEQKKIEE